MNSTSSATSYFHVMSSMLQLVCVFVLLFGIIGNGLVLILFGRSYSSLKTFEVYMLSLAAADFIGTLIFPSIQLHTVYGGDFNAIGAVGCKIIYFMLTCSITSSAMTLVVVSFDRFIIVKWPLRERLPPCTLGYTITIPWILGVCHGMIYLIGDRTVLEKENNAMVCRFKMTMIDMKIFTFATLFVQNIIPAILMLVIYVCILRILYKSATIFHLSRRESVARRKRNKRALRLLMTVISVFFTSTVPHNVFHLWYVFNFHTIDPIAIYPVYILMTMLYACNSCLNPLIYARLHVKFRHDISSLFCCYDKFGRRIHEYLTLATSSNGWFSKKTDEERVNEGERETNISSDLHESDISTQNISMTIDDQTLQNLVFSKETVL